MLGDGLCSVLLEDNEVKILLDDKSDKFSNITNAISANTKFSDWKILEFSENDFKSVLLCTDGISDDLNNDIEKFALDFFNDYCIKSKNKTDSVNEILESLLTWKVPKHSDDKTIACLYKTGVF
jgi:serine/threonine protein phosphatase PrpC